MTKVLGIAFSILAMSSIALCADNSIGTWKYNAGKSKVVTTPSPLKELTITREAVDGGVKVTAKGERQDGSKIDTATTMKYDGSEVSVGGTGLAWDTTSAKQINADTFTETRTKKGGKYHSSVRTVVSKDGKTMTATSKGTGADGKPFTSMIVFDKQ